MNLREKPVTAAKPVEFSNAFKDSLQVLPMVQEMAAVDHHSNLEELSQSSPEIVNRYCDLAHAGLRGLRKFEEQEKRIRISNVSEDDMSESKSAFALAYAAIAFSGFLVGILSGWLIWE